MIRRIELQMKDSKEAGNKADILLDRVRCEALAGLS